MRCLLSSLSLSSTASRIVRASTQTGRPPATVSLLSSLSSQSVPSLSRGSVSFFSTRNVPFIRRVPAQVEDPSTSNRQKWRTHAVSLNLGDYPPMEVEDDNYNNNNNDGEQPKKTWKEEEMELANEVKEYQQDADARKKRWIETAKPPVRHSIIDDRGRSYGRGGRKTASARVWIQPGLGHVVINHKDLIDYFDRTTDRELVLAPLAATATCGKFDITAMVEGGGLTGQAGAIRHGLARALNHYNPDLYRPPLKRLGYLTRDPRKVERKKVGHLKARKKPQWVKR